MVCGVCNKAQVFMVFGVLCVVVLVHVMFMSHYHNTPSYVAIFSHEPKGASRSLMVDASACAAPIHIKNESSLKYDLPKPSGQSFSNHMNQISVDELIRGLETQNHDLIKQHTEDVVKHMFNFHIIPPKVPIDENCKPAELPKEPDCSAYPGVFSGPRSKPAKLGLAVQMAFEVDTLEIALHQYEGLIDRFFIVEAVKTQYRSTRQPLLWEAVRDTPRFKRFTPWVVHLALNDADMAKATHGGEGIWSVERYQERQRWKEIKMWNDYERFFEDEDVIGFGDVDEIPSRENLQLLKHCQLRVNMVDVGIWMTQGRLSDAYHSIFGVSGYPYTLGDPTFFKYSAAVELGAEDGQGHYVNRQRGSSGPFVIGGMHMTFDGFLTARLLKLMACTECELDANTVRHWRDLWSSNKTLQLEHEMLQVPQNWLHGRVPVETVDPRTVCIPWLLACNPERYPVWRAEHDTRLD
jgi:hypothetical protein